MKRNNFHNDRCVIHALGRSTFNLFPQRSSFAVPSDHIEGGCDCGIRKAYSHFLSVVNGSWIRTWTLDDVPWSGTVVFFCVCAKKNVLRPPYLLHFLIHLMTLALSAQLGRCVRSEPKDGGRRVVHVCFHFSVSPSFPWTPRKVQCLKEDHCRL